MLSSCGVRTFDSGTPSPLRTIPPVPGWYEIKFLPEGRVVRFAGSRGNYSEFEDGTASTSTAGPSGAAPP
jgi:hypothetical protein